MLDIEKKTKILEIFIQMILIVRFLTSLIEILCRKNFQDNSSLIITLMFFSFTLSELLPLSLVVYGIYQQIDWNKVAEKQINKDSNLNQTPNQADEQSQSSSKEDSLDEQIEKSLLITTSPGRVQEDSNGNLSDSGRISEKSPISPGQFDYSKLPLLAEMYSL